MSQRFEYGYGPRGYCMQLSGEADTRAEELIRAFVQGIGWRPVGASPAVRRARFVVPVEDGEAWSGEAWDDGPDPFGRPGTVGACGSLTSLEGALRWLGGPSLAAIVSEAADAGRAVVLAPRGQLYLPDTALLLDPVDETNSG